MTVSCYTLLIRYTYGKEHKQGGIMEIYSIKDEKFRRYGKVWSGFDCTRRRRESLPDGSTADFRFRSVIVTAAITD